MHLTLETQIFAHSEALKVAKGISILQTRVLFPCLMTLHYIQKVLVKNTLQQQNKCF